MAIPIPGIRVLQALCPRLAAAAPKLSFAGSHSIVNRFHRHFSGIIFVSIAGTQEHAISPIIQRKHDNQ
jgi:hypothetical protein